MHPFVGLDEDRLRPRLSGSVPRPARPLPPPGSLRRLEPLAAVFLGLHGVMVLANLEARPWQWAGVALVLVLGMVGLGGRGPAWTVPVRGLAILVVGVALQATAGGAGGWFAAWPFVLVAVYPLVLPGPSGPVLAGLAVLGYVLVVRLAGPAVGPTLAVARGVLLVGLAGLAWTAAGAYARMANLAVEAELELGRRERLVQALLDALTDPPPSWTPRAGSWPSTSPGFGPRPATRATRPWLRSARATRATRPWPGLARATRPPAGPRPPPAATGWRGPPPGWSRSWPARRPCSAAATCPRAPPAPTSSR